MLTGAGVVCLYEGIQNVFVFGDGVLTGVYILLNQTKSVSVLTDGSGPGLDILSAGFLGALNFPGNAGFVALSNAIKHGLDVLIVDLGGSDDYFIISGEEPVNGLFRIHGDRVGIGLLYLPQLDELGTIGTVIVTKVRYVLKTLIVGKILFADIGSKVTTPLTAPVLINEVGEVLFPTQLEESRLGIESLVGFLGIVLRRQGFSISVESSIQLNAGFLQSGLGLFGSHALVLLQVSNDFLFLSNLLVDLVDLVVDGFTNLHGTDLDQSLGGLGPDNVVLELLNLVNSLGVKGGITLGAVYLCTFKLEDISIEILLSGEDSLGIGDGLSLGLGQEVLKFVHPFLLVSLGLGHSSLNLSEMLL